MIKNIMIFVICATFLFVLPAASSIAADPSKTEVGIVADDVANWTVMYYMCGDSSLHNYVSPVLENLSHISSSAECNLLVLKDQLERGDSKLYYIDHQGHTIELNEHFGWPDEIDMSDAHTIERYCTQMMNAYPAEHYAFITYASGGTGWQLYCINDKSDGAQGITIPALAWCFQNITDEANHKVDVIFVSCAMNTIELAYEVSPYVDYIVGTQDCLSYEHFMERFYQAVWDLRNNTDMTPEEFANRAPERLEPLSFYYRESYEGILPALNRIFNKLPFRRLHCVTHFDSTSVINLTRIDALMDDINLLATTLQYQLHEHKSTNTWAFYTYRAAIKKAREQTKEYSKCYAKHPILSSLHLKYNLELTAYDCVIDLYDFVEKLKDSIDDDQINDLCSEVMQEINRTISSIKKLEDDRAHGLSIYFPPKNAQYDRYLLRGTIPCSYEDLRFSQHSTWNEFLNIYLNL